MKFEKEIKRKFGKKAGYFSNSFISVFDREIYIEGELNDVIIKFKEFFLEKGVKQVLVFPEDKWNFSETFYKDEPLVLNLDELLEFLNKTIEFGASNYYISTADLNFRWVFTICNEKDFHFAGSNEFVDSVAKHFNLRMLKREH